MQAKRKSIFLLVLGIVCLALGVLSLLPLLMSIPVLQATIEFFGGMILPSLILGFVGVGLLILCGILGILFFRNPAKARVCAIFGIILIACRVAIFITDQMLNARLAQMGGSSYVSPALTILGIAVPVLYALAAILFIRRNPRTNKADTSDGERKDKREETENEPAAGDPAGD